MRLIEIRLACDWIHCDVRGLEGSDDVVERTFTIDGRKPKTFHLCKEHDAELDRILYPLLSKGTIAAAVDERTAVAPERSRKPRQEITCRVPGCGRVLRGNVGLAQHIRKKHGYRDHDEYIEANPATVT